MKMINPIYIILLLISVLTLIFSCEETDDFDRYVPAKVNVEDSVVAYTDIRTYPYIDLIATDTPKVSLTGSYSFILDSIAAPSGSTFISSKFKIDKSTGVISYQNTGELSAGIYTIGVGVATSYGIAVLDEAVKIEILDIPLSLSVDNSTVTSGALDQGVIATVSYTDTSGEGVVTSITYELVNPVLGFTIDATTGAISKTTDAAEGSNKLSVTATSNVGSISVNDLVTVTVGAPPTIAYFQQDGTTNLIGVTVSPWTAYTTTNPSLNGMDADGGYDILLPSELSTKTSSFSVDANGSISIASDADLPVGVFSIGVKVTNSSAVSKTFENLFTLTVENREVELVNDQLNEGLSDGALPEIAYPGEWMNYNNGTGASWVKKVGVAGLDGIRVFRTDHLACDVSLTRTVTVPAGLKTLILTFGEYTSQTQGGANGDFFTSYDRLLYYGESATDLAGGAFDAANWTDLMPANDIEWSLEVGTPSYSRNIDVSTLSGNNLVIHWRIIPDPASTAIDRNGQWLIDYLTITGASAFAAEEQ